MDSHRVHTDVTSRTVKIGDIVFDNCEYDAQGDVLYANVGEPGDAVSWIGTSEGDGTSHGPDGSLIGLTILNAKHRLEHDGKIELTLPEHTVTVTDLGGVLGRR